MATFKLHDRPEIVKRPMVWCPNCQNILTMRGSTMICTDGPNPHCGFTRRVEDMPKKHFPALLKCMDAEAIAQMSKRTKRRLEESHERILAMRVALQARLEEALSEMEAK